MESVIEISQVVCSAFASLSTSSGLMWPLYLIMSLISVPSSVMSFIVFGTIINQTFRSHNFIMHLLSTASSSVFSSSSCTRGPSSITVCGPLLTIPVWFVDCCSVPVIVPSGTHPVSIPLSCQWFVQEPISVQVVTVLMTKPFVVVVPLLDVQDIYPASLVSEPCTKWKAEADDHTLVQPDDWSE